MGQNNTGVSITSSNNQPNTNAANTLKGKGFAGNRNASSRFLQQASFGPTYEEIEALSHINFEQWIDQQFNTNRKFSCVDKVSEHRDIRNAISDTFSFTGALPLFWEYAYWEYTLTSEDVLRQRIALALSEILVISRNSSLGDSPYAFASYNDILLNHAFGNYRQLLTAVTFHSGMGRYLTYMNNPKQDTVYEINQLTTPPDTISSQVIFPDENYAREIMQLFTIGLFEINIDGTRKISPNGRSIPTYDNEDIAELSKIFTGLTWAEAECEFGCNTSEYQPLYYQPMVMKNGYHDPGQKKLLNGHIIPPRIPVDGVADIEEALDNLFNHPNVGPFIGKLLIQRLVTSNPSPDYISRVAKAFNGESHYSSVRGDMKAVIKAILLDDEARNCANQNDPTFGKLREPFIRYLQLCLSFKISSPNNVFRNALESPQVFFGQKPFGSPSVFNFFQPDYQPIGPVEESDLVAPEFQITDAQTIAGYMSLLNRWLIQEWLVDDWGGGFEAPFDEGDVPSLDLSAEVILVDANQLPALIDRLDMIIAHGQLSPRTKELILHFLNELPLDTPVIGDADYQKLNIVRVAIYLIMSSPDYLIDR